MQISARSSIFASNKKNGSQTSASKFGPAQISFVMATWANSLSLYHVFPVHNSWWPAERSDNKRATATTTAAAAAAVWMSCGRLQARIRPEPARSVVNTSCQYAGVQWPRSAGLIRRQGTRRSRCGDQRREEPLARPSGRTEMRDGENVPGRSELVIRRAVCNRIPPSGAENIYLRRRRRRRRRASGWRRIS